MKTKRSPVLKIAGQIKGNNTNLLESYHKNYLDMFYENKRSFLLHIEKEIMTREYFDKTFSRLINHYNEKTCYIDRITDESHKNKRLNDITESLYRQYLEFLPLKNDSKAFKVCSYNSLYIHIMVGYVDIVEFKEGDF